MQARRDHDQPAITLDVDLGRRRKDTSRNPKPFRSPKIEVRKPRSAHGLERGRQFAVSTDKIGKLLHANFTIDVDHEEAAARDDADVGARPSAPPLPNDTRVAAGHLRPRLDARVLASLICFGLTGSTGTAAADG